jgi:hypothetical protein
MGSNALLKKIDQAKQDCFVAGCDITAQQMFDMMCLVLNDPEIMGKDVFGAERLKKVHDAMFERERIFHDAWMNNQESDYYQEKLDAALRRIFGEIEPFSKRYPYLKEWNYNKPSRR